MLAQVRSGLPACAALHAPGRLPGFLSLFDQQVRAQKTGGALQTGIAGRENRFADSADVCTDRHSSLPDTPSTRIGSCVPSLSAFTAW